MSDSISKRNEPLPLPILGNRSCLLIFVVALAARLILLWFGPWIDEQRALQPDSTRYLLLAENLRNFHTLGLHDEENRLYQILNGMRAANGTLPPADSNGLHTETFRTPGYPLFIAAVQICGGGIRAILTIQCLLDSLAACMAASIAISLGLSRRAALLVGFLWALHPGLILNDVQVLSDSFANFWTIAAIFLISRSKSVAMSSLAGIVLGLSVLIRPLAILYLPAALVLSWRQREHRWLTILLLILMTLVPASTWALRNRAAGEGLRVSSVGSINLLYYLAGYVISEERGQDWLQASAQRRDELSQKLESQIAPHEDVFDAAARLGTQELAARPKVVARVYAKSMLKLLLNHSLAEVYPALGKKYVPSGFFSQIVLREQDQAGSLDKNWWQISIALVWMLMNAAILLGAIMGIVQAVRRRDYAVILFCVPTIFAFLAATHAVGVERMRLPILLPLFLLVGSLFTSSIAAQAEDKDGQRATRVV